MNRFYYYKKASGWTKKRKVRLIGILFSIFGIVILFYVLTPLILWEVFLTKAFAKNEIKSPIPTAEILTPKTLQSLISSSQDSLSHDYLDAANWFPTYDNNSQANSKTSTYFLSIPKIHVKDAVVSTKDTNLAAHLVSIAGSVVPPDTGSAIIFGHSTLPQLFNPTDYKTIFSNTYLLTPTDTIIVTVNGVSYTYKISSMQVVDPEDTSALIQQNIDSQLILVTCTPPGTTWKRLIISASLVKI